MKRTVLLTAVLLGLAPPGGAQRFGFTHRMVPVDVDGTPAAALGDLDGDGDLDVFVGNANGRQERVYLNDGAGSFRDVTATNVPVVGGDSRAVALGDVDGDGDLDVLVGNFGGEDRLFLNSGAGVFTDVTATSLPPLLDDAQEVRLGDVDGDGDLDAFIGNSGVSPVGQNRLCLNDGTGGFTDVTASNLPALPGNTQAIALGDVDGDGDLDAYVGNYVFFSVGQNRLYLNDGTGVFTDATATNLPVLNDDTAAIALADVDGDGDLDALLGESAPGFVGQDRLNLNDGTGVFTDVTATNLPSLLDSTLAVALGDLDGDGDLDALVGNYGQNGLLLNGGSGIFTDATATSLSAPPVYTGGLALGDVDQDGDLDAYVAASEQDRLYLNDGAGVLFDVTTRDLPDRTLSAEAIALGDLDGDGDLDAFIGNTPPAGVPGVLNALYLNAGTGTFTDATPANLPPLLDSTQGLALGDMDGDGDLDVFVGNNLSNALLLNGGTGIFTDVGATNLPALFDSTRAVGLGDLDGDGDLDALLGTSPNWTPGLPNRLYLNDGTSAFLDFTSTNLPAGSGESEAVALGDVDADGDLDAIVGNPTGFLSSSVRLYLNGGSGTFSDATAPNLPVTPGNSVTIALGDVDVDGDLDVFVGNFQPFPNRLFLNLGTGGFVDATATNLPGILDYTVEVAFGDVDQDGDLDACLASYLQLRLYLNGGTGAFSDGSSGSLLSPPVGTQAVALGDVDGDGDLDALAGRPPGILPFTNLTRQLAWRGIPRAGKPLTLDLWGPASGTWLLAASAGSASIPVPVVGTLRLLPSTLFIVAGGALDPQGSASLTFPVPANPALVGLSLYWQALVGPPLRFTNLEVTTVTDL